MTELSVRELDARMKQLDAEIVERLDAFLEDTGIQIIGASVDLADEGYGVLYAFSFPES